MRSKIDIYNGALLRIGENPVVSPDEENKAAETCNQFYDQAVEQVLSLHQWNCATARTTLARNSEPPAFGWLYAYNLPGDCVTVISMQDKTKFVIEGRELLTDCETCSIKYIKTITDPNQFSPGVTECLILVLASKIAPVIKNDSKNLLNSIIDQLHQIALPQARMIDAHENDASPPPDGWLDYDTPPMFGYNPNDK